VVNEQAKTIEVLQLAVRMEVDGKEFYKKASKKSSNKLAKELFRQLADEEDIHRRKFVEIYETFKRGQNWPDVAPPAERGKKIKSIFAEATRAMGNEFTVAESEFEAIKIAMNKETQSYDLYYSRSKESRLPVEKQFYQTLAGEERGHHLALLDAYEYLGDPVGWFTKKEHWSLDGI